MAQLRRLDGLWRHASFSIKFSAVILVAGAMIAVVPLLLAQASTRGQAADRAADKVGIAANLISAQRQSLDAFAAGVARQVAATNDLGDSAALATTLQQDAAVNESGDVLGVVAPGREAVVVSGGVRLPASAPLVAQLVAAVEAHEHTVADRSGQPWLLSRYPVSLTSAVAVVARPVTAAFISAIDRNLATPADPADIAVMRNGRFAVAGTIAGAPVAAGAPASSTISAGTSSATPSVVSISSADVALATASLGAGYTLVVSTPVATVAAGWQPILLLLALILVAMLFIVVVVQTSLQRPLRRLDRAVAALGRGEFDVPVPTGSDDELGRLETTFEAMRRQLHATIRATDARAAVATELSASQPLETSLNKVCAELRRSIDVDAALIVVTGSEMSDPFSVVDGVRHDDMEVMLSGDGPLGAGFRFPGAGALVMGATAASDEAHLGLHEFCVAPLRVGKHVHGVLAACNASKGFMPTDVDLIASTAEQVALALERYRFLAVVQRQASIDDLTSLYNHRFLVDYLGQQVALAERLNNPLAILMLDIDHFKVLNDTHGHQAGDTALAAFSQTLLNSVRRSDLAARYGGEEFSVVMANTRAQDARLVAEKIRAAVAGMRIELAEDLVLSLTVSIGGSAYPEDTDSASELLALADEALYRAKRGGRDRTCMSSDTKRRGAGRRSPVTVLHTPESKNSGNRTSAGERYRSAQ